MSVAPSSLSAIAVIPARYGSTRFPGKPLVLLRGVPMVVHVYRRCVESNAFVEVIVATDDERIARAVESAGGSAQMTSESCASGTDRVAEVARALSLGPSRVVVNVQGDEPAMSRDALAALVRTFDDPDAEMATLVRPLTPGEGARPSVVKAVVAPDGRALYFSRANLAGAHAHVGMYGYRAHVLQRLASLPPSPLERAESLEQLRALEHGVVIRCRPCAHPGVAVDLPEDVPRAEEALLALEGKNPG